MKLIISELQFTEILNKINKQQDLSEEGEPETGESSDGDVKTGATTWSTGLNRGVANQIGNTKWSDSYNITRGKANPLK